MTLSPHHPITPTPYHPDTPDSIIHTGLIIVDVAESAAFESPMTGLDLG
jgi:hypothetical protein